jgi:hypothetical protein
VIEINPDADDGDNDDHAEANREDGVRKNVTYQVRERD